MPGGQGGDAGAGSNGGSSSGKGGGGSNPGDGGNYNPGSGGSQNRSPQSIALSNSIVKENRRKRTKVGDLSTIDPDSGDTHRYTFISGSGSNDNNAFVLDGNVLRTRRSFNFERKNSYTIRVQTTDSAGNTYEQQFTIRVKNVRESTDGDPNRKRQLATNLGTLTTVLSKRDSIGGEERNNPDRNDYFGFSLKDDGSLTVTLNRLKADADFQIFNSAGVRLYTSTSNGRRPDTHTFGFLEAGDYYVRVFPDRKTDRTKYRLLLSTTPAPVVTPPRPTPPNRPPENNPPSNPSQPQDVNGTFATATDVSTIPVFDNSISVFDAPTGPEIWTGSIGYNESHGRDTNDYFKFTHTNPGSFALSITDLSADADLQLYDSNFNLVVTANASGTQDDLIYYTSAPTGTYYARVTPYSSAQTNYRISFISSSGSDDGFGAAEEMGVFYSDDPLTTNGSIDYVGENEFYRFRVGSFTGNDVVVRLTNLTADADIQIFNGAFEYIEGKRSTALGSTSESVVLDTASGLSAGDIFYVRVKPFLSNLTSYTLSVTDA
jgi:hypothetical protein